MALTKNLKRTGRAAVMELADQKQALREQIIKYTKARYYEALDELKRIDPEWEAWFDDDNNIPDALYFDDWSYMKPVIARIWNRVWSIQHNSKE